MSYVAALDALAKGPPAPDVVQVAVPRAGRGGRSSRIVGRAGGRLPGRPRAGRRCSTPPLRRAAGARAWRASCSRPPTSSRRAAGRGSWWSSSSRPSSASSRGGPGFARSGSNLTPYDVLTIASMVEREAQLPRERRADRLGDLQPPARGDPAGHRRHRPLRHQQLDQAADPVPAGDRLALQHARAPGPAARADRQPRPGGDQGRRRARAGPGTCSTSSSPAPAASTSSRRPTPSSSATWSATTASATRRGGKSPTNC